MEKQYISEYPYGQFPTRFTKKGQQQHFEQLTSEISQPQTLTINESRKESPQQNSFDISKLLPLIKLMSDKKSISSTDMLQMFIPLLGGNYSSNINDIMSLINPSKQANEDIAEDIPPINSIKIDDYKRIE